MKIDRSGLILYTLKYKECVQFYKDVIGLPVLFTTHELTCFQFGGSYLMVEIDDSGNEKSDPEVRQQTCIRMNVEDVKAAADLLRTYGVEVNYQEFEWGTIAKFRDPDGNLCAFKDSLKFEEQVEGVKK